MTQSEKPKPLKGRGAVSNIAGRFAKTVSQSVVEEDACSEPEPARLPTEIRAEYARTVINRNQSPDIPFRQSINPYRGCEHGCIYCYARPSHAYVDLSPGLDFETKLFFKKDAAKLLRRELAKPSYRCQTIVLGANTDPYQLMEKDYRVTRDILEVLDEHNHPVAIVTKSALVTRDVDILSGMAARNLAAVAVSVTSLRNDIKRTLEPRAAAPAGRLKAMRELSDAGVPVTAMVAPVIPLITDGEIEDILEAAHAHGARDAAYILLRLPYEVKDLFKEWLETHYPLKAEHVLSLIRQARGGRENDPRFGHRMRGAGPYADLLRQRFNKACRRLGLNVAEARPLDTRLFRRPQEESPQLNLW
ncbi:MAG: PA0069 family radical SAM protein [Gammaproteobacteria bacterium]|nr:PA0069 family radical SAM protein [Gammaproteobacteria bacterium]